MHQTRACIYSSHHWHWHTVGVFPFSLMKEVLSSLFYTQQTKVQRAVPPCPDSLAIFTFTHTSGFPHGLSACCILCLNISTLDFALADFLSLRSQFIVTSSENPPLTAFIWESQHADLETAYSLYLSLFKSMIQISVCINYLDHTIIYTLWELKPCLRWFTAVFSVPRTLLVCQRLSCVCLCDLMDYIACSAPLSMEFSRQKY